LLQLYHTSAKKSSVFVKKVFKKYILCIFLTHAIEIYFQLCYNETDRKPPLLTHAFARRLSLRESSFYRVRNLHACETRAEARRRFFVFKSNLVYYAFYAGTPML